MVRDFKWTSLKFIDEKLPEIRKEKVSVKARSQGQFISQFRKAKGNPDNLPGKWRTKRNGFVARTKKSMDLHEDKGHNTKRQKLALNAWAYDP